MLKCLVDWSLTLLRVLDLQLPAILEAYESGNRERSKRQNCGHLFHPSDHKKMSLTRENMKMRIMKQITGAVKHLRIFGGLFSLCYERTV